MELLQRYWPATLGLTLLATATLLSIARAQTPAAPVFLNHPAVVDTAHLKGGDTVVTLFGVQGWAGDPAHAFQSVIAQAGNKVTCQPQADQTYVCKLPNGADVAQLALATGAAKTLFDAPADYHSQEATAAAAHRGLWAGQQPGPAILPHPTVQTTAQVAADGRVYPLDGIEGFEAPYYRLQLQDFIDSHGGQLSCEQKSGSGRYVCYTPEGTDIATVALLEGLARVSADASPEYRADQTQAVRNKSGFWFNPPQQVLTQLGLPAPVLSSPLLSSPPDCCVASPNTIEPTVTYDDGIPVAVIDSVPVFFVYIREIGWGFYDHLGRWHTAPEQFRNELARTFPNPDPRPALDHPGRAPAAFAAGSVPRSAAPDGFGAIGRLRPTELQSRPASLSPPTLLHLRPMTPLAVPRFGLGGARPGLAGLRGTQSPIVSGAPHAASLPAMVGRR